MRPRIRAQWGKLTILSVISMNVLLFSGWPSKETARGILVSWEIKTYKSKWKVLLYYSFNSSPKLLDSLLWGIRNCLVMKMPYWVDASVSFKTLNAVNTSGSQNITTATIARRITRFRFSISFNLYYMAVHINTNLGWAVLTFKLHTKSYRAEPKLHSDTDLTAYKSQQNF